MENGDPYSNMSHPTADKCRAPYHATYTDHQDMMLSEEEEECATLAEPMTLEGAKQLAQTSVVVPASTPTPPAVSIAAAVSPPTLTLVTPPLTSPHHHHLTSPPPHHHPLASPPPPPAVAHQPHPHLTPALPHHHHIWGPPSVSHDDEQEEEEEDNLPSTVDIQAIRDSPSPDHSQAQLVTINENWDSMDHDPGDEDSDEEDSDTDASESESDSRLSSRSHSRSCSPSRESIKSFTRSRCESRSPSPSNSRSDSGSQDSDSDSSAWSDSSSSGSDDERKKEDGERDSSPVNKPLPRRKPQLTAPKLTLNDHAETEGKSGDPLRKSSGDLQGSSNAGNKSPALTFSTSSATSITSVGFAVSKISQAEDRVLVKSPLHYHQGMTARLDIDRTINSKALALSKSDDKKILGSPPILSLGCNSGRVEETKSKPQEAGTADGLPRLVELEAKGESREERSMPILEESPSKSTKSTNTVENASASTPPNLKAEEVKSVPFQPYKQSAGGQPEGKCDAGTKWDDGDKGEELKNSSLSPAELEERRREKQRELNREFDRLLFSTKNSSSSGSSPSPKPNEQKSPVISNDLKKHIPFKLTNAAAMKYNKVYDAIRATKSLNYVTPQRDGWHINNIISPPKPEKTLASVIQAMPIATLLESKDVKTKNNSQGALEDKLKDASKVEDKSSKDAVAISSEPKEVQANCDDRLSVKNKPESNSPSEKAVGRGSALGSKLIRDGVVEKVFSREPPTLQDQENHLSKSSKETETVSVDVLPVKDASPKNQSKDGLAKGLNGNGVLPSRTVLHDVGVEKKVVETLPKKNAAKEVNASKRCVGLSMPDLEWNTYRVDSFDKKKDAAKEDVDVKVKKDNAKGPRREATVAPSKVKDQEKKSVLSVSQKSERESSSVAKCLSVDALVEKTSKEPGDKRTGKDKPGDRLEPGFPDRSLHRHALELKTSRDFERKPVRPSSEKKVNKNDFHQKSGKEGSNGEKTPEKNKKVHEEKKLVRDSFSAKKTNVENRLNKDHGSPNKFLRDGLAPEKRPHLSFEKELISAELSLADKKFGKSHHGDKLLGLDRNSNSSSGAFEKGAKDRNSNDRKTGKDGGGIRDRLAEVSPDKKVSSKDKVGERKVHKHDSPEKRLNRDFTGLHEKILKDRTPDKRATTGISAQKHSMDNVERLHSKLTASDRKVHLDVKSDRKLGRGPLSDATHERNFEGKKPLSEVLSERKNTKDSVFNHCCESGGVKEKEKRTKDHDTVEKHFSSREQDVVRIRKNIDVDKKQDKELSSESRLDGDARYERKFSKESTKEKKSSSYREMPHLLHSGSNKGDFPVVPEGTSNCREFQGEKYVGSYNEYSKLSKIQRPVDASAEACGMPKLDRNSTESHCKLKLPSKTSSGGGVDSPVVKGDREVTRPEHRKQSLSLREGECPNHKTKVNAKCKCDKCDKSPLYVCPTIADVVKGRERRKSTDLDKPKGKGKGGKLFRDETSTDSESSEELNEKVDLDTEQTQTFNVSESNFNQGRLTMKIAAMKMAKFGQTGLREVTGGVLPTRSDLLSMSFSPFRRPRTALQKAQAVASSHSETHKVKTAAERKTYSDALPPNGAIRSLASQRKKNNCVYFSPETKD
ncbi:dentin sialophosphoprotein-like [Palaemon carinicauda]|uniref:dentin sialophosphoprotein-like n=1 Tax=Palaemon carinicauda TaxID=392227 RepID=UPI0035B5B3B1